jgi:aspartate/methionine/tyrosine aminotransferase
LRPYGRRGNSVVRHLGESYDQIVLVGGLSKAYSSLAAFIACPRELKRLLKTAASPYLYSGPSPVASLATAIVGLEVNEARGDEIRARLWDKTDTVLRCLQRLGAHTPNRSGLPIIEVPLADGAEIDAVGRFLFDNGIYVTLAAYPLVPRDEVGFRIQVTDANTVAEIEQLVDVLGKLANTFDLQPARAPDLAADAELGAWVCIGNWRPALWVADRRGPVPWCCLAGRSGPRRGSRELAGGSGRPGAGVIRVSGARGRRFCAA